MLLRNFFALSLLTASTSILAETVDINLRDNSAQLQFGTSIGRDSLGTSNLHAGILYTNDKDRFGDLGIMVKEAVGSSDSSITAGVGIKGLVAKVGKGDVAALAIGGQIRFSLPANTKFGIVGQLYYSPNITTYRDADRFTETTARLEYDVIPQAAAYLGYRRINFGAVSGSSSVLDSGFHLGVRMSF